MYICKNPKKRHACYRVPRPSEPDVVSTLLPVPGALVNDRRFSLTSMDAFSRSKSSILSGCRKLVLLRLRDMRTRGFGGCPAESVLRIVASASGGFEALLLARDLVVAPEDIDGFLAGRPLIPGKTGPTGAELDIPAPMTTPWLFIGGSSPVSRMLVLIAATSTSRRSFSFSQ